MLAAIVNRMLGEIERLIGRGERRLRQHRARPAHAADAASHAAAIACSRPAAARRASSRRWSIASPTSIRCSIASARCCASPSSRICAGAAASANVDLGEILREVHELYAPLAEDSAIAFRLEAPPRLRRPRRSASPVRGASAISSRTRSSSRRAAARCRCARRCEAKGPRVDIVDSGPGIPSGEREAVLQRFYRSERRPRAAGAGLRARAQHRLGDRAAARLSPAHRRQRGRWRADQRRLLGRCDDAATLRRIPVANSP